jgi:hypothetical protein
MSSATGNHFCDTHLSLTPAPAFTRAHFLQLWYLDSQFSFAFNSTTMTVWLEKPGFTALYVSSAAGQSPLSTTPLVLRCGKAVVHH